MRRSFRVIQGRHQRVKRKITVRVLAFEKLKRWIDSISRASNRIAPKLWEIERTERREARKAHM